MLEYPQKIKTRKKLLMKVYNDTVLMHEVLNEKLSSYRAERGFNASEWIDRKVVLINAYFAQSGLSGAVVGVSGGIDSAVALSLVVKASQVEDSPIKKIVPILLPAFSYTGATHQNEATNRAECLCQRLGLEAAVFHQLTPMAEVMNSELENILGIRSTPWAKGQLVAYTRTPILYSTCSILTDAGYPALVIGTTNLSEGGYLGYVGKAADGMVDLQVVSDLYKSEVYQVAEILEVPKTIMKATPTGDMFDGRDDETVFGASYDFVELYHLWLQNGSDPELLNDEIFAAGAANLEKMHKYNGHKYLYGTPSVHLDILRADIPGGWNNKAWSAE
jgi:NAD+ synthetase